MDEEGEKRETPKEEESAEEKKEEKDVLKGFFIWMGICILIIVLGVVWINSLNHFTYEGVRFNIIKEGEVIFYNSAFPVYSPVTGAHVADYNVYLRNDPRGLQDLEFNGGVKL